MTQRGYIHRRRGVFLASLGLLVLTTSCDSSDADVRSRGMVKKAQLGETTTLAQGFVDNEETLSRQTRATLTGEWRLRLATPDYDINMPVMFTERDGQLIVETIQGTTQAYTIGSNVAFTIPVEIDDQLIQLGFAGRVQDGMIEWGIAEAQGDGATLSWTASRA